MTEDARDWRKQVTPFQRRVYEAVLAIPKGEVRTYGQIARSIGSAKAARAVGQALKRNRWPRLIPCHRVVAEGGRLGGYSGPGRIEAKRRLLEEEGVPVEDRGNGFFRTSLRPQVGR